jgi:hypothetical protein
VKETLMTDQPTHRPHEFVQFDGKTLARANSTLDDDERTRLDRIVARPRVRIVPAPERGHEWMRTSCEHCDDTYANCVKSDVAAHATRHRDAHRRGLIEVTSR